MTRIIGVGDVHEHPGPRNVDRLAALDQIIREGSGITQLGAWAIPGDLFDAKSTAEGRNALDERLQRMASVAPVLVVYGNHDAPGDLDGFARLKAAWPIYVFDRPHVGVIRLATGQMAAVFALPYPHKAGLVSAGLAPGDVVDTAADLLDPIFMVAAGQLQAARDAGYLTFMIAHANIVGALASTGQPQCGREIEVSVRHLDRLGSILKLFSHIHKPQEIGGAIFIGSICRLSHGETEEKRYIVADIADDSSYTYESKPIDVAPMWHVEGRLDQHGFSVDSRDETHDEEIHRRIAAKDWAGCDVRVRYTYRASERSVLSEATVRELFTGALRLKVESVAEADRELRAPAVAAAKTLPEKLAAYFKVDQLSPSRAEKLALLEVKDGDQLLAEVAQAIAAIEQPEKAAVAA